MTELQELRARIEALEMWLGRPWPNPTPSPAPRPPKAGDVVTAEQAQDLPAWSKVANTEWKESTKAYYTRTNNGWNVDLPGKYYHPYTQKKLGVGPWRIIQLGPAPDAPEHLTWPVAEAW